MTSLDPNTEPTESPSSETPPAEPASSSTRRLRTAPLRVRRTPSPTPSTDPSAESAPDFADPIEHADPGNIPSSDEPTTTVKVDKTAAAEIARKGVLTLSLYAHSLLARDDDAEADLWIATDRDQAQIGNPLASIAIRHGGPAGASLDLADLIAAGIGLAAYLVRNAADVFQIRRARRKMRRGEPTNHNTGEPA